MIWLLILRTLASLDSDAPRYYTQERNDAVAQADEETQKWLDFASEVDNVARLLIRVAVRSAAEGAASTDRSVPRRWR